MKTLALLFFLLCATLRADPGYVWGSVLNDDATVPSHAFMLEVQDYYGTWSEVGNSGEIPYGQTFVLQNPEAYLIDPGSTVIFKWSKLNLATWEKTEFYSNSVDAASSLVYDEYNGYHWQLPLVVCPDTRTPERQLLDEMRTVRGDVQNGLRVLALCAGAFFAFMGIQLIRP